MLVVDASVVVDLIAPDVGPDSPARALFARWASEGTELLAPGLLWPETANALLTGIRRGRWSGADADAAAVLLDRQWLCPPWAGPRTGGSHFAYSRR